MRATTHFGRTTKGGKAFSAKHNDRNYDEKLKPENVISEKSEQNKYHFCWFEDEPKDEIKTFEDHEKWVYQNYLGKFFEEQNERNRKARHLERLKTIDQYRKMSRYCPEEVLWYVGKKGNTATAEQLEEMAKFQIDFEEKRYPGLKYLDWAVHVDELGAPHVQARRIWTYEKNDVAAIGQNKALEKMGVALPNPKESISESNNRKITYTAESRQYWIELAENLGFEIEKEPRRNGGKTLSEWQKEQDLAKRSKSLSEREQNLAERSKRLSDAEKRLSEREKELNERISSTNKQIDDFNESVKRLDYAYKYNGRADDDVAAMVQRGAYSETSPSKTLFGALKKVAKGFSDMRRKFNEVMHMSTDKLLAHCIKAKNQGCENMLEYFFPEIEQHQKIEPVITKKQENEGRGGR